MGGNCLTYKGVKGCARGALRSSDKFKICVCGKTRAFKGEQDRLLDLFGGFAIRLCFMALVLGFVMVFVVCVLFKIWIVEEQCWA